LRRARWRHGKEAATDRRIDRPLDVDSAAVESEGGGTADSNPFGWLNRVVSGG
jgi:hypothetical protein